MGKISIIIPVYNVESYLAKCLDSVINQTHENIEILCINDGSTDNGGMICDEYAKRDRRMRVFHKDNGGLSTALNIGLQEATGDYIGFVDSDDWIENDMFEVLYNALNKGNALLSVGNFYVASDTESAPMKNRGGITKEKITTQDLLLYPLMRDDYRGFCSYVWNKLYDAKAVIGSKLLFDEEIKYGMDVIFYYSLVLLNKCSGVYTNKPIYHYYQREGAITKTKSFTLKHDILKAYKQVEQLFETNGYTDISFWVRGFYCYHASVVAEMALDVGDREELLKMQHEMATHFDDYVKTNEGYPNKVDRIRRLLIKEI